MTFATILAAAVLTQTSPTEPPVCLDTAGEARAPLVSQPDTAMDIFVAVERDFFPAADLVTFPDVGAEDEGSHWVVFRWRQPADQVEGPLVLGVGGQLEMDIAKCDGAISNVRLTQY